jgi:hypothetical protein
VARSVRALTALAALGSLVALSGCVTTQTRSERAQITATRLLASRKAVRVTGADPDVRVSGVSLVRGAGGTAVVAQVTNVSSRALTDLPVSAGVVLHGRRHVLNGHANLDYFQTHVASIAPHGTARWVFTTKKRVPSYSRPFALVGAPAQPAVSTAGASLPDIRAAAAPPAADAARTVRVQLSSRSGVPQYGLPVYVLAHRGARLVGAGRLTLAHLGTAGRATVAVPLVGAAGGASLDVQALPSIFH